MPLPSAFDLLSACPCLPRSARWFFPTTMDCYSPGLPQWRFRFSLSRFLASGNIFVPSCLLAHQSRDDDQRLLHVARLILRVLLSMFGAWFAITVLCWIPVSDLFNPGALTGCDATVRSATNC